ncbi:interferon-induced, double-stranded RNA-activated protein kinase-like isoform X3 [Narcine bancroftii]|uniref:interferon-induced, double-stranded RNA-activated protein kinase-like isoform X3 n=1 Tax=Narcine bancroftii TaxID=1343680 RepID=UPI0038312CFD
MTTTGPTSSTVSFLYMEKLQLYAGRIEKPLIWLESQSGPPHDLVFTTCAKIGDDIYPKAEAKTKKKAKHNAAKCACEALNLHSESNLDLEKLQEDVNNQKEPNGTVEESAAENSKREDADNGYKLEPSISSLVSSSGSRVKRPLAPTWTSSQDSRESTGNVSLVDFEELVEIAAGGFGKVYKAKKRLDDEFYAIKEIPYQDENSLREVKSLAQMDHPNIVRYYTCWLEESFHNKKTLYIQMKLYKTNLRVWMEEFQNNLPRQKQISRDLMHQLLDGVHYIHQKKMVHRDLKPANILLSEEEGKLEAKIGDFGLVRVCNQGLHTVNVGTPAYMSPEQRRADYYDYKVDIFALGLIFFDLLWIYYGTASEKIKCWEEIRKGVFDEKFVEELPIESALIRQMLLENARDRPEADEVKQTLISSDAQTNR